MLGPVVSSQPDAKRHPSVNTSQIKEMRGPKLLAKRQPQLLVGRRLANSHVLH